MGAFLSVAKGSQEKPWLLELRYNYGGEQDEANPSAGGGGEDRPIVLVGKGTKQHTRARLRCTCTSVWICTPRSPVYYAVC